MLRLCLDWSDRNPRLLDDGYLRRWQRAGRRALAEIGDREATATSSA
jgi:hypothetical protein